MDREIKVTRCGEQEASDLNDRISIEFAPYEVSILNHILSTNIEETRGSPLQDNKCQLYDALVAAHATWQEARYQKHVEENP